MFKELQVGGHSSFRAPSRGSSFCIVGPHCSIMTTAQHADTGALAINVTAGSERQHPAAAEARWRVPGWRARPWQPLPGHQQPKRRTAGAGSDTSLCMHFVAWAVPTVSCQLTAP